jgi:transketolase
MFSAPYATTLKPYGEALVELGTRRPDVLCLSADLTRQCEVDLFRDVLPQQFINVGMAEANMLGIAGALARRGYKPFVHTFGVFATRRALDQLVNSVAYPDLPVRIAGFMPGISSPGGPSHQAIEDVALMRAVPNVMVIDLADASEIRQCVEAIVDLPHPVYVRLKRGEIPIIFEDDYKLDLTRPVVLRSGSDVAVAANGMMLPAALAAAEQLEGAGVSVTVVNCPVIKPLNTPALRAALEPCRVVVTAENHSVIGGLGSAVAETVAEAGLHARLRRIGLNDTFAEGSLTAPYLFNKYGLTTQAVVDAAWQALEAPGDAPRADTAPASIGEYAPV